MPTRTRINERTLELLLEADFEGTPERDRWLNPNPCWEENDRYVVIGEEVLDEYVQRGFGGCWPDLHDALQSYDWNAGAPVYVIDLFVAPEEALIDVKLTPSPGTRRTLLDPNGGPTL